MPGSLSLPVGANAPPAQVTVDAVHPVHVNKPLRPGALLDDRFAIEGLPRHGGMGLVHRARDLATGRAVAVKLMGRWSERRRQRFAREAMILASLEHDAIVRYVAHGLTQDGSPYLAMEWLDGEDLSECLKRGGLPFDDCVRVLRRACEALTVAHARGIVHRDIKPSNLFLVDGNPASLKVLDFGISREAEAVPITRDGDCLGTVGYMAPEQAMGQAASDPRVDVFALGCVFYECLTGRAPFESPHAVAVLAKVLRDDPPSPSELSPALHPGLDPFVARLLAKAPSARPANAEALRVELDAVLEQLRRVDQNPRARRLHAEQKIASIILGKPPVVEAFESSVAQGVTMAENDLRFLSRHFSADAVPLQGGALLLLLSTRGEAHDRAAQAAQCALALRRLRPELRLAVATGLAETTGPVPVGVAIDRAAALLECAEANTSVIVDDLTAGLIGHRFELLGAAGCHVLLRARAELHAPRSLMGKPTPCVGRDMELRLLESAIEECIADGSARAVLVTGAPGIGKSRLASEWLEACTRKTAARILVARADPMTSSSSLSLVQDLLRDSIALLEAEAPAAQHARLSEHIRALIADDESLAVIEFLAELLGMPAPGPASPMLRAAHNNPEIMRERVRRSIDAWLDAAVDQHPLVLVLEDLHWADAPSVELLTEALRRNAGRPLMLLALARPEVEQQFPQLCQHVSLHVRLSGLTARAAERLIRAALSPAPSDEVIKRVVRTAEGNAFYLEELIRRVSSGSTDLPDTVLAMAQSRLDRLEPAARRVLCAASVFGEVCWAEGVARMVDISIDCSAELDLLAEREILTRVPNARYAGTREYRFRHALLRDAAYATLTQDELELAHCAAGAWLEGIGENEARLLAEHFASGKANGQAVPWLVRAARAAIDHGDLGGTVELSRRGIELGASGLDRGLLLLACGHAETWSGNTDVSQLRGALELLPHGSAPWWLAVALLTLAESASGRPHEAATYVSLALTAPPSSEQVGPFGQALLTLVGALVLLGHGELCGTLIERAQALPAKTDDPIFASFLRSARCALTSVAPIGGHWHLEYAYRQGCAGAEAMRALGATCGEAMALNYFAVAATHLGRYADARQACLRSLTLARHVGSGLNRDWAGVFLAKAQVRLGQSEDALSTLSTLHQSRDRNLLQMLPAIAGEALFRQQRFAEAITEAEIAVAGPSPRLRRMAGCGRARALLALHRPEQALAAVEQALKEQTGTGLESEIDLLAVQAEALSVVGQLAAAREVASAARQLVLSVADTIADSELQLSFLQAVEPCARALRLADELAGVSSRER